MTSVIRAERLSVVRVHVTKVDMANSVSVMAPTSTVKTMELHVESKLILYLIFLIAVPFKK